MKKHLFSLLSMAVAMLGLAACSSDDKQDELPSEPPVTERIPINLQCGVLTRATDTGYETNDRIGLYVVNYTEQGTAGTLLSTGNHVDNMGFTYNGQWTPDTPIYWLDDTTPADFYCYYPYTAGIGQVGDVPFEVKVDQSAEADYKASEFLYGKTLKVKPTEAAVVINTRHLMSCMVVKVAPGNGFTDESLAASEVSVRLNGLLTQATIDLTDGSVSPAGTPQTVSPLLDNGSYKALVVPQTVDETNLITVTVDGRDYNLTKGFTFESAVRHTFTVTVSKTSNGINVNIEGWTDDNIDNGGTAE